MYRALNTSVRTNKTSKGWETSTLRLSSQTLRSRCHGNHPKPWKPSSKHHHVNKWTKAFFTTWLFTFTRNQIKLLQIFHKQTCRSVVPPAQSGHESTQTFSRRTDFNSHMYNVLTYELITQTERLTWVNEDKQRLFFKKKEKFTLTKTSIKVFFSPRRIQYARRVKAPPSRRLHPYRGPALMKANRSFSACRKSPEL